MNARQLGALRAHKSGLQTPLILLLDAPQFWPRLNFRLAGVGQGNKLVNNLPVPEYQTP